jgi:hypothetical protein
MSWLTCLFLQALDRAKSDAEKLKKLVHGGSFRRLVCANTKLIFSNNNRLTSQMCASFTDSSSVLTELEE